MSALRRAAIASFARRLALPPAFKVPLRAAGLHPIGVWIVDGFGPVAAITVVLARRRHP